MDDNKVISKRRLDMKIMLPHVEKAAEAALFIYVFFIPIRHVATVMSISMTIFVSCIIFKIFVEKKFSSYNNPLILPLLFFVSVSLISCFLSIDPSYSFDYFRSVILKYIALFLGITILIKDVSGVKRLVFVLIASYAVIMFFGLFEYFTYFGPTGGKFRFRATFNYYAKAGLYSLIFLPPVISLFLWEKKVLQKILLFICAGGSLLGVLLTQYRGAWISLFLAIILIGFVLDKRILAVVLASLLILPFILPKKIYKQGTTIFDFKKYFVPKEKVLTERPYVWKASLAMIKKRPILGAGSGREIFEILYNERGYRPKEAQQKLLHAHNQMLEILVENGVLGLLCFLWLIGIIIKEGCKAIKSYKNSYEKFLITGIFSGLMGIFVCGFADVFMWSQMGLAFWVFTGLFFAIIKTYTPCEETG